MKERIGKLDFIKIKNVCSVKDNVKRMKRKHTDWEKIIVKDILIKDCYSKYKKRSNLDLKIKNKENKQLDSKLRKRP